MTTPTTCPPPARADVPDPADLLPLARAARLLPATRGDAVAPSTPYRWATRGVVADDGVRVRLRVVVLGGAMRTTAAWLAAFGDELAARRDAARAAAAAAADPAAVAERRRQRDAATRATLLRAGIIDTDGQQPRRRARTARR